jgi:hypothetical protein
MYGAGISNIIFLGAGQIFLEGRLWHPSKTILAVTLPVVCISYCQPQPSKHESNNKTTWVWFLREQKHTRDGLLPKKPPRDCRSRGLPGQRPSRLVCFCSLINHTSVVLYLSYATKTAEKNLLILEFHTPSSPWVSNYDITSTCPTIRMTSLRFRDDTDATEEIRMVPHMLYLIFLYHPQIPRLDHRTPRVKSC